MVVREPPPKLPPVKAAAPNGASDNSPGVLSSVMGALFGGNGKAARAHAEVVPTIPAPNIEARAKDSATTQPSELPRWQMKLGNGDILNGRIEHWADQKISFKLSAINGAAMEFPADQMAELWCTDAAARTKARALTREPGPEDAAFVKKDSDVVAVKGLVLGVDADSLLFRFDDQDRKIALAKLVGIVRGAGDHQKASPKFHQKITLDSGDEISGIWTAATADAISLQTTWGTPLRLPLNKVYAIDFVGGRLVYLSDLKPDKVEQTPYFGRVMPWRADRGLDGGPLRLSDGQYARGIAMHSRCVLDYDIQRGFERFNAKVGFEQPAGKIGNAVLRVIGDGKVLYENADARGDQPPVAIDLDVNSVQHLTIEVDFGKTPEVGARVIWANARLLRAKVPE